ncbi:MAG: 4Fe-4S binding protein, partial [Bacteroides sp.]
EWQINRAMHLAGRCTGCGACGDACPIGIPIHLLTHKMMEDIGREFAQISGRPAMQGNVLSTFRVDDKEEFIQ